MRALALAAKCVFQKYVTEVINGSDTATHGCAMRTSSAESRKWPLGP